MQGVLRLAVAQIHHYGHCFLALRRRRQIELRRLLQEPTAWIREGLAFSVTLEQRCPPCQRPRRHDLTDADKAIVKYSRQDAEGRRLRSATIGAPDAFTSDAIARSVCTCAAFGSGGSVIRPVSIQGYPGRGPPWPSEIQSARKVAGFVQGGDGASQPSGIQIQGSSNRWRPIGSIDWAGMRPRAVRGMFYPRLHRANAELPEQDDAWPS